MNSFALSLLFRTSGGNVPQIASLYILQQEELSPDDHAFLVEHIEKLGETLLLRWLCRQPPQPSLLVDALFRQATPAQVAAHWWIWSGVLARDITVEDFDHLVERMHGHVDVLHWWGWARFLRGSCEAFQKLVAAPEQPSRLVHVLFPHRRDEKACTRVLRELARDGLLSEARSVLDELDGDEDSGPPSAETVLRDRAALVALLEKQGLLDRLVARETLPERVTFSAERGVFNPRAPDHFFLSLALRWPDPFAREWYVNQFVQAVQRGAPWSGVVGELVGPPHLVPEVRRGHTDDPALVRQILESVADASWDLPLPAPWLGIIVLGRMTTGTLQEWEVAFRFIDLVHRVRQSSSEAVLSLEHMRLRRALPWLGEVDLGDAAVELLDKAPLPRDANDTFDARFVAACAATLALSAPWAEVYLPFRRLTSLPLTAGRASRLLEMALSHHVLFGQMPADAWEDVASFTGSIGVERLPPVDEFLTKMRFFDAEELEPVKPGEVPFREQLEEGLERALSARRRAIPVYRRFAGPGAEANLRAWVREPLTDPRGSDTSMRVLGVLTRLEVLPSALDDDLRKTLSDTVETLDMFALAEVHEYAPGLVDAGRVLSAARAAVSRADVTWDWLVKRRPAWLPTELVLDRAVFAGDVEFTRLIEWLQVGKCGVAELVTLCLDRLARGESRGLADMLLQPATLLGKLLASRSLWERHGPRVMRTLLQPRKWLAILGAVRSSVLLDRTLEEAPDPDRYRSIVGAAHEALAVVMIERLREGLDRRDTPGSLRALRALVALHPRAGLSGRLYGMRKRAGFSTDVHDLLEVNIGLMRHGTTRDATVADLENAMSVWFELDDWAEPRPTEGQAA